MKWILTVDAQSVALPVNGSLPLCLRPRWWKKANDIDVLPAFFFWNALIQNKLFDGWKKKHTNTHARTHTRSWLLFARTEIRKSLFYCTISGNFFLRSFVFSSVKRESRLFTNVKIVFYLKALCFKFYPLEVSNYFLILFLIQRTMLANANPRAFSAVSSRFSSTEAWNQRKYAQFKGEEQKKKLSEKRIMFLSMRFCL